MGFLISDRQCKRAIHVERRDCGASCGRDSYHPHSLPTEMRLPEVETRVEERDVFVRLRI